MLRNEDDDNFIPAQGPDLALAQQSAAAGAWLDEREKRLAAEKAQSAPTVGPDAETIDQLRDEMASARSKKALWGAAGGAFQGMVNAPSAYEILTKTKSSRPDINGMFGAVADSIGDPASDQQKAYAYMKAKRDSEHMSAEDSPGSPDSIAMQEQIGGMFPAFKEFVKGKSASQIKEMMPILTQKIRGDTERTNAEIAAGGRKEARADAAQLRADAIAARKEDHDAARAAKQMELSGPQAKQRGLYESGKLAEDQYNKAIGDGKDFDPTSNFHPIDNSRWAPNWMKNNKAIESQAAQSAWVESYLRDASGAAIPNDERLNYAKDFFARPGDTPAVVTNKAALRRQKEENAKVASGIETGHGPKEGPSQKTVVRKQVSNKGNTKIIYSDGTEEIIPATAGQ